MMKDLSMISTTVRLVLKLVHFYTIRWVGGEGRTSLERDMGHKGLKFKTLTGYGLLRGFISI